MTEEECLAEIASGRRDALDILRDVMPEAERRFKSADRALVKLLDDVRKKFPDAEFYTAGGGFTLMLGKSHADKSGYDGESQSRLVALVGNAQIGDGDF